MPLNLCLTTLAWQAKTSEGGRLIVCFLLLLAAILKGHKSIPLLVQPPSGLTDSSADSEFQDYDRST
jgi:hypothetical protein